MAKTCSTLFPKIGTGRFGLQVAIRRRLYAAADHLLIIQNTGYTEEYKRVAFADIRYLMVMPTNGQVQQGMVSGGIALFILFLISNLVGIAMDGRRPSSTLRSSSGSSSTAYWAPPASATLTPTCRPSSCPRPVA